MRKITKRLLCMLLAFAAALSALAFAGCDANSDKGVAMNETFYNPIRIEEQMGDPWMYYHDGYYYYTHSSGTGIRVTKSPWMTNVVENGNDESVTKTIFRQKSINVVQIWAPEVFFFDGHWYAYFTATQDSTDDAAKDAGRRTYGMKSKTDDIFGEWETAVEIELPCDYRSIDATFMDYNGRQYIIWSGWPSAENQNYKQNLYITELETGNPLKAKSTEDQARVLLSEPTYAWEMNGAIQNEGPCVCFSPDGTPFVLFSGSYSGGDAYCIGYVELTGEDPMQTSSWTKGEEPLMQTSMFSPSNPDGTDVIAPGHNSVVPSPDGTETWICYHSAKYSGAGWDRMARLQKLEWENGKPVVHMEKFSAEVPLPSGEKVNRVRYEAEEAEFDNCTVIDIENKGYASGDKAVSISAGGSLTFDVAVPKNGEYLLYVRFSNREATETVMNVTVNGERYELYAPQTQYSDCFVVTYTYCSLYLRPEGNNTISIGADQSIYIDCIIVDHLNNG